jgi:starvation-inducible outer membrane lipoprotein
MKRNVRPGILFAALWIVLAGCATVPPTPAPSAPPTQGEA